MLIVHRETNSAGRKSYYVTDEYGVMRLSGRHGTTRWFTWEGAARVALQTGQQVLLAWKAGKQ